MFFEIDGAGWLLLDSTGNEVNVRMREVDFAYNMQFL